MITELTVHMDSSISALGPKPYDTIRLLRYSRRASVPLVRMAGRGFLNALPFNKRDLKKRDLAIIIQLLVPMSKNNE